MRRLFALILCLAACNGSDETDTDLESDTDTDTDADSDTDSDTDTDTDADTTDEALVRDLIDGSRTADEVFPAVAWSGGWPVRTDDGTVLFVHWYEGGSWSVAGDFNAWTPAAMTEGDGFWWAEVEIAAPEGQLYKFVSDGTDYVPDPWARSYGYDGFGEFSYVAAPTDTFRLDRWPGVEGQGLQPRDVRVYVPAGTGPWPVLYAHDGQNLFDPEAFFGGWRLQDAVASVGEPVLIVGIDNTSDRMHEYTHVDDTISGETFEGWGDAYAALVEEDIRPHVEAVYGSTGHDGVMGSSLGGLISLHIADTYPDRYDFVASLSGTLGWGRFGQANPVMEEIYGAAGHRDFAIYVDSGGDDGGDGCDDVDGDGFVEDDPNDGDNYCANRVFADAMAGVGYTWETDLWHWHDAGAQHNEAAWAGRVDRPLGIFLSLD